NILPRMQAAFAGLRLDKRAAETPEPFEIACACGEMLRGQRQPQAQTIRCPVCQSSRFVLPRSPLPRVVEGTSVVAGGTGRLWDRWPLVAVAILSFVAICVTVIVYSFIKSTPPNLRSMSPEELFATQLKNGRAAYKDESFQLASTQLKAALYLADA